MIKTVQINAPLEDIPMMVQALESTARFLLAMHQNATDATPEDIASIEKDLAGLSATYNLLMSAWTAKDMGKGGRCDTCKTTKNRPALRSVYDKDLQLTGYTCATCAEKSKAQYIAQELKKTKLAS